MAILSHKRIAIRDEGILIARTQEQNFTGAGVTATAVGNAVEVAVPGGGGGPPGPAGATGPPGIPGDEGEEGQPGTPGRIGVDGVAGAAGAQGPQGLGAPGVDGEDGDDGNDGSPGIVGPVGPLGPFSVGGTILSPAAAINVIVWRARFACTVTNVRGYRVGGTGATINARKNGTLNHLAADLSLTSADTWMDGGAVQNTAYAVGDKLEIMLVTLAGSPAQVAVQVDATRP